MQTTLKNPTLWQTHLFIAGAWRGAVGGQTFAVTNKSTGAVLAEVADAGAADAAAAIEAAAAALPAWRALAALQRSQHLRAFAQKIIAHKDDIAEILHAEQGKPVAEALAELTSAAAAIDWAADEARRVLGDVVAANEPDLRISVLRQPVGVVAAITPWNFPASMITRKCGLALAAGCTVVIKPSEYTPLTALALAVCAAEAGLPAGVLNIIPSNQAAAVGQVLCTHPQVRKIGFTGSTRVGQILMQQAAGGVKRLSLELGGNAPFIIFADADVDAAVADLCSMKFRNCGQACTSPNRVLVDVRILPQVQQKLAAACAAKNLGPLINRTAVEKVESLVADAVAKGAVLAAGGHAQPEKGTNFYAPTLLAGATPAMDIFSTEIFGPVLALYEFKSEAEAIKLANDTIYGLAAYVYARDYALIARVSEALDYGMVGVNSTKVSSEVSPFGGMKQSGFGREGSHLGIHEFLEVKAVVSKI